jgi:hypothetical protein
MRARPDHERAQAFTLRTHGFSIREIAERIDVPWRTVGTWLRGRGDCHEVRHCGLCGARFFAVNARHRFCTPAHARKHFYVKGSAG